VSAEEWAQARRAGLWRFVLLGGTCAATSAAAFLTLLGVLGHASFAHQAGSTLDFRWFEVPGQPGEPTVHVLSHCRNVLPVGFLVASLFFASVLTATWVSNERAHRQVISQLPEGEEQGQADSEKSLVARAVSVLVAVGVSLLLGFMASVVLANQFSPWRWPPRADAALDAVLCAGYVFLVLGLVLDRARRAWRWLNDTLVLLQNRGGTGEPHPRLMGLQRVLLLFGLVLLIGPVVAPLLGLPFVGKEAARGMIWSGAGCLLVGALLGPLAGLAGWTGATQPPAGPPKQVPSGGESAADRPSAPHLVLVAVAAVLMFVAIGLVVGWW
jgi:hypothetical protein